MRLISQNNLVDVPYEQFILTVVSDRGTGKYFVRAISCHKSDFKIDMAEYSTRERAKKVLLSVTSLLATLYVMVPQVFVFPEDKEYKEEED